MLDTGCLEQDWYAPLREDDHGHDMFSFFAPYRAGWDHGNAATIYEPHPALGDFPQEGYCDLQCYDMVQGARSLRLQHLPGEVRPILWVVPMWRPVGQRDVSVPLGAEMPRLYHTEQRAYLAELRLGQGEVLVCSLRLMADPAGRYLLERLVGYISREEGAR